MPTTHNNTAVPSLGYVLKGYPRISETFISNEILLLEQLGLTLRLFPMRQPRENFTHASVKKIKAKVNYLPTELLEGAPHLLPAAIFCAMKQPRRFLSTLRLAAAGITPGTSNLATLKHFLQGCYLANNFLLKENIVHLHGHFAHSPTSVTLFAAGLGGIPFSFTAHAKDIYTSSKGKLRKKMEAASFVVTCTQANKQYLDSLGAEGTPVYCLYHGIDISLFSNAQEPVSSAQSYQLLSVARMTAKKGLPTVYKALAILRDRGVTFHHTLIGDGDDRDEILALIKELGLTNHCTWLGTRTHEEVIAHFRSSDLFVLGCEIAANGDRDGIPNVLVESLAMGIPALSSAVSAIPEILINGQTGITVEPQDPFQLADAMERVLSDPALRNRLQHQGRDHVCEHFDNQRLVGQLAELFKKYCPSLN